MKKAILILTLINVLFNNLSFSQVPNYVPTNGLIGWWPFSGNANDLSGNGNNGTVNGSALTTNRFGTNNDAYSFNGSSNYISLPNVIPTQIGTISFWFQTNSNNAQILVYQANSNGDDGFGSANPNTIENHTGISDLGNNNGSVFMFDNSSGTIYYDQTSITHNQWYHMAVSYNNSTAFCYLNGVLIYTMNISSETENNLPTMTYIGRPKLATRFLSGKFDDLGVWNRVLSSCEILALYNSQLSVLPTITASGSTSFCQGGSVQLSSSAISGNTWSNGSTSQSITVSSSGSYTVTVSNGNCSSTSLPISVSVNPTPPVPSILTSGATTFCQGGSVQLISSSNSGNTWSNSSTSQSITVSNSGNYTVTASNGNCSSTSLPISVSVNQLPPVPTIFTSGPTTFCQGSTVQLTSSSNSGNTWSNGSNSQSITVSNSGTYTVTSSNGNCTSTSLPLSVTVNSNPTVTMTPIGNFININENPIGLVGNPSGGSFSGNGVNGSVFNPQIAGLGISNINYNYTNISGCSGNAIQSTIVYDTTGTICTTFDTIQVTVNDTIFTTVTDTLIINTTLGLPAPNNENTILIYPNPASNYITIDNGNYAAMTGYTIKIESNAGQQVFQSVINQAQFIIDLSTWTGDGLYFVHLIDAQGNTVTIRKIVLQ